MEYKGIEIKLKEDDRFISYEYRLAGKEYSTYDDKELWDGDKALELVKNRIEMGLK